MGQNPSDTAWETLHRSRSEKRYMTRKMGTYSRRLSRFLSGVPQRHVFIRRVPAESFIESVAASCRGSAGEEAILFFDEFRVSQKPGVPEVAEFHECFGELVNVGGYCLPVSGR